MKLTRILAALAVALLATVSATPAHAATRPRPVTLTVLSSGCVNYTWTVTIRLVATTSRTVDVYDSSDYGSHPIVTVDGQTLLAVPVGPTAQTYTYQPGSSAQYAEIGAFPAGTGGWDGRSDPLASATVRDPIQYGPALC